MLKSENNILTKKVVSCMIKISHKSDMLKQSEYAKSGERREGLMVPFQKIAEACKSTGLSQYYLRQGCKNGTVPHIKSGGVYYVNVPALMDELDKKKSS